MFLEGDKVLYFLKAIDMKDRREQGSLLEDKTQSNGLITDRLGYCKKSMWSVRQVSWWLDDYAVVEPIVQGWVALVATTMSKQSKSTKREMEDNDVGIEIAMDYMAKANDENVWISSTLVLETLEITSLNQCKTQEMETSGEEVKIEAAYDEDISIVETCLIEKVNRYESHEFKDMDKENALQVEVAMNNNMKEGDKCTDTPSPAFF